MAIDVGDLLDLVYEAAVIPDYWSVALEGVAAIVDADGGAIMMASRQAPRFVTTRTYELGFEDYIRAGKLERNIRPQRAMALKHHGFLADLDLCTQEELDRDPIYQEFLQPNGFGWTVGTLIPVPTGDLLVFELARRVARGPYEPEHIARLDLLRPHLARAALLAARLGLTAVRSAADALGAVGLPAAILGGSHQVLAANTLFEALSPRVATAARDRLHFADPAADRLLRRELERPLAGIRSLPIPAIEGGGPPLVVHLVPVRRAANDLFNRGRLIVVITPVIAGEAPTAEVIQGLFDLTAAEARVARGLLEGGTAAEIAEKGAVSVHTVRTQIKAVLAKTGMARQADLVALLAGGSLPIAGVNKG